MNRTERLAAITLLLLARRRLTAGEIARTFEISERTVYRDLDGLTQAGLPLIALPGMGGGYELPSEYRLMPLTLTQDEGIALWAAIEAFIAANPEALGAAARVAWAKISAALGDDLRRHIVDMAETLDTSRAAEATPVAPSVFALLVQALRDRRRLHIVYAVPVTGETTERPVDVYGLACARGRWYAPAYCHLRKGLRVFRVDRIESARLSDEPYLIPHTFHVRRWLKEFLTYGSERRVARARVHFAPQAARRVVDDRYFRSSLARNPDGSFDATLDLDPADFPFWASLILGYGGQATAIEPAELRREVARMAEAIASSHAAGD